jgi:hypothetical protein
MKKFLAIAVLTVVGIMTIVVGVRLSTDALSIIVGALLGMMAILPTIALVAFLLKKNQEAMASQASNAHQPPVVVVSGGVMPSHFFQPQQQQPQNTPALLPPPGQSAPRKFHLMGYEETERLELSDDEWAMTG